VSSSRVSQASGSRSRWSPSSASHARSSGEGRGATPPSARRTPKTDTAASPSDRAAQSASTRSVNGPASTSADSSTSHQPDAPAGAAGAGRTATSTDPAEVWMSGAPADRFAIRLPAGWAVERGEADACRSRAALRSNS
jgi:hypothetical protein